MNRINLMAFIFLFISCNQKTINPMLGKWEILNEIDEKPTNSRLNFISKDSFILELNDNGIWTNSEKGKYVLDLPNKMLTVNIGTQVIKSEILQYSDSVITTKNLNAQSLTIIKKIKD